MENEILLSEELISNKIYFIRNQKVMFDSDLAMLYGIKLKFLIKLLNVIFLGFLKTLCFNLLKLSSKT